LIKILLWKVDENMRNDIDYRKVYILIVSLLECLVLYVIEQGIGVNYGLKTLVKIILFTVIPLIYIKVMNKESFSMALRIKEVKISRFRLGLLSGIVFFIIVSVAYLIAQKYIDLSLISRDLETKLKITPANFILVGVYITFGNSFLEEFFFRGFIFMNLYKLGYKKLSYIFSSVLFAIYHISIFKTWFSMPITLLTLFALMAVSFLFDFMDTKSDNFINSWFAHMFADTAVIIIGLKMFQFI
jgi:membrane protease YdiL (CAAX protease family)